MRFPSLGVCLWVAVGVMLAASPEVAYRDGAFVVAAAQAFTVSLDQAGAPALAGTYERRGNETVFTPRYPVQPGASYRVAGVVIGIPDRPARAAATVTAVYPTGPVLPENQLKLYLHFSAPMSRGEAVRRIRLRRASGAEVREPFLEIDEELWDPEGRRLTLLFDPGRIKRGLLSREEAGGALIPGERYSLIIDGGWPDAFGQPLARAFQHDFTAGPADRTPLRPKQWRITAPTSAQPLIIDFGEAVDSALAVRLIRVLDSGERPVAGSALLERHESRFSFRPSRPWLPGTYTIEVNPLLEDVAGNWVNRAFDVDPGDRVTTIDDREAATHLVFVVRP